MAKSHERKARRTGFLNRLYARLAVRHGTATAFLSQPEPRTIGSFARGRQLVAGNLQFAGYVVQAAPEAFWTVSAPDAAFDAELHGFTWLDDLAAVGDLAARERAQRWLRDWIDRFGRGRGPGWTPDLTGRRVIRWINHAPFLLRGLDKATGERFFVALSRQTWFLSRRWPAAAPGLPRFEALAGLVYAGLSLEGREALAEPAIRGLARCCKEQIDAQGGLPTRNPEELLEVFTLLNWAAAALSEAGRGTPQAHAAAIARIAPTLRALRHSDGGLARFHGGGRGLEGRLDHALAASHARGRAPEGLAMGFARLARGRTTVIVDASPPPAGAASASAHASTLAFELTSGRRPLIVNCGSGASFGAEWRRAGRATPSHSTLCLGGYSSARLGASDLLGDAPRDVPATRSTAPGLIRLETAHDGYVRSHGLTHARKLDLSSDGRRLDGEDLLLALDDAAKRRFDRALDAERLAGLQVDSRFHLHPDVDASIDLGGSAVSLALRSGEIWVFRHDGQAELHLEASVYLEKGRLKPRATKQIVLSRRAMEYATATRWSLSKAQETAIAVRDLGQDTLAEVALDAENDN